MAAKRTFLGILLIAGALNCHAQTASQPLGPAEQMELSTLAGQLSDASRSPKTKAEAAEMLLMRPYAQAVEALKGFLEDASNRSAQMAVAEAIAGRGNGQPAYVEPLLKMLTGEEASVRSPAARALATYKDPAVTAKLVAIAMDAKVDRATRLAVIDALHRVLDKTAVDALVRLLGEGDGQVRAAAAESLAQLTNIRHFGADGGRWNKWWQENKDKPRSEWLADLAESLARSSAALEAENTRLRERLATAMSDLYLATPGGQRDAMLLTFLKDPLADVRLVGLGLSARRADAHEDIPQDVRSQVRTMLVDGDGRVREAAAMLTASLADADATAVLLDRLKAEESPSVRQSLLKALGRLRDPKALQAILEQVVQSKDDGVASSASAALMRIVEKQPLEGGQRDGVVKALLDRYAQTRSAGDGVPLRESLLSAMGMVRDPAFVPALEEALKDPAATVRLAAVNALAQIGKGFALARLAPLVGDVDRGVRQAAISALGSLGGRENLETILQRTDPAIETDAAVRQQAWDVAMDVLAKADTQTLGALSKSLADRPDAKAQRVRVMQLLLKARRAEKSPEMPATLRELGALLMSLQRPAEAAPLLAEVYAMLSKEGQADSTELWWDWVNALLAAGDPAVMTVLAEQNSQEVFAAAVTRLEGHLAKLSKDGNWPVAAALAEEATKQLAPRLSGAERKQFERTAVEARAKLAEADRQKVHQLVVPLQGSDEAARKQAAAELQAMGQRAVAPLLEELQDLLRDEKAGPDAEKAVLSALQQIAPKLTGYDLSAPKSDRLKLVDKWLRGGGGN